MSGWLRDTIVSLLLALPVHIRPLDQRLGTAVRQIQDASPTFRRVLDRINDSNVVVYLSVQPLLTDLDIHNLFNGYTTFMVTAVGLRYVHVVVNRRLVRQPGCQLAQTIGHELWHVAEIADHSNITTQSALRQFYNASGYVMFTDDFIETDGAVKAGVQIAREVASVTPLCLK